MSPDRVLTLKGFKWKLGVKSLTDEIEPLGPKYSYEILKHISK